ncbi:hypothetical protein CEXT_686481 [Caerostris extrusa]|uniref:Uncharacterized protein n=1 Tax=Caerostris extrusa TaxID=172846 RepID=A0AAV4RJI4_CAEEX|nr:hypothetical protein CEXT_686481 [Caerostris extrusa]
MARSLFWLSFVFFWLTIWRNLSFIFRLLWLTIWRELSFGFFGLQYGEIFLLAVYLQTIPPRRVPSPRSIAAVIRMDKINSTSSPFATPSPSPPPHERKIHCENVFHLSYVIPGLASPSPSALPPLSHPFILCDQ